MTDTQLRQALRDTLEAASPPPPMSSADALHTARRALFRRRAGQVAIGSAGALALAALASTVLWLPSGGTAHRPGGPGPTPNVTAPGDNHTAEPMPTGPDGSPQEDRTARAGARHDSAVRLLDTLLTMVPAGYTVPTDPPNAEPDKQPHRSTQANFEKRVNGTEVWSYMAEVAVTQGERVGRLLIEVHTPANGLPTEPCAMAQKFWEMAAAECQVLTAGGQSVGVVLRPATDTRFDQWAAYRHSDGTVVFVAQSRQRPDGGPALTNPPFTAEQLAALAVDNRLRIE